MDNIDIVLNEKQKQDIIYSYKIAYDKASEIETKIISQNKAGRAYGMNKHFDHYHVATSQLYFPKIVNYLNKMNKTFETGVELACGTTTLFDYFKVNNTTLLELADKHFEFMKKKGHNCLQGNIENIPLGDKVSDITVSCNILNVNLSYNKAIDEIKRITKDDGIIIIVLPWEQSLPLLKFDMKSSPTGLTLRTFNDSNFKERFEDKGLKLIEKQFIPAQSSPNTIQVMNLIFKKNL
tara:strand:+ start:11684 stop:12394 length:711 start_codon:yes stop_codon:yes gene_type:complete